MGTDASDGLTDLSRDRVGITLISNGEVAEVLDMLCPRKIGGHLRAFAERNVFRVFHHADNFDVAAVRGIVAKPEAMTNGGVTRRSGAA